jgi:hypothetical protein
MLLEAHPLSLGRLQEAYFLVDLLLNWVVLDWNTKKL